MVWFFIGGFVGWMIAYIEDRREISNAQWAAAAQVAELTLELERARRELDKRRGPDLRLVQSGPAYPGQDGPGRTYVNPDL